MACWPPRATRSALAALEANIARARDAARDDLIRYADLSAEFSMLITRHCGNRTIHLLASLIYDIIRRQHENVTERTLTNAGVDQLRQDSLRDREKAVALIRARAPAAAEAFWRGHLEHMRDLVLKAYKSPRTIDVLSEPDRPSAADAPGDPSGPPAGLTLARQRARTRRAAEILRGQRVRIGEQMRRTLGDDPAGGDGVGPRGDRQHPSHRLFADHHRQSARRSSSATMRCNSSMIAGARPIEGSSSSSSVGRRTSALAIASICRSPPLRLAPSDLRRRAREGNCA